MLLEAEASLPIDRPTMVEAKASLPVMTEAKASLPID